MSSEHTRHSVWRKSWADYRRNFHSGKFWFSELIVLAAAGGMAKWLAPPGLSEMMQAWFATGVSITTGLSLAALFYAYSLILAPSRLLHDADKEIAQLKTQQSSLEIEFVSSRFLSRSDMPYPGVSSTSISDEVLVITITFRANHRMQLAKIVLKWGDDEIQARHIPVMYLDGIETYDIPFVAAQGIDKRTERLAVVEALANGAFWESAPFTPDTL